jgi:hypothetical protein
MKWCICVLVLIFVLAETQLLEDSPTIRLKEVLWCASIILVTFIGLTTERSIFRSLSLHRQLQYVGPSIQDKGPEDDESDRIQQLEMQLKRLTFEEVGKG